MFARVLVGFDGSPRSRAALIMAMRLAHESQATLTALTVHHHLPRAAATVAEVDAEHDRGTAEALRLANEVSAHAAEYGVVAFCRTRVGSPARELVQSARDLHADLVVLGHSRRRPRWATLLGSTVQQVSHQAPCSVLIVR